MEDKRQIPTENPNHEQDAIRRLLLLYEHIKTQEKGTTHNTVMESLREARDLYHELGGYLLIPTSELLEKAMAYFNTHIEEIRELLRKYAVSDETIEAVTQDYGGVLCAQFAFKATPTQMLELLKKIKPYRAFMADKYVLYYGVMRHYATCVDLAHKFNVAFRNEGATAETKREFMNTPYGGIDAMCLLSLRNIGFIEVHDFEGVERQDVINWLDNLEAYAHLGQFSVYYALASLVLGASTEQLNEIQAPEFLHTLTNAEKYAELYTEHVRQKTSEMADEAARMFEAETAQEQERAKKEVEDWKSKTNTPVVIGHNIALIQSRDLYTSRDAKAKDILPISAHIEDYMKRHKLDETISPYVVEKAVVGINLLQRLHNVKPNNGRYTFYTSISEFANVSYGWDANEEQKKELFHALKILHNLYIVVWKPTGRHAIQLVSLKDIGLSGEDKGKLTIEVTAQAMTGEERPISAADFKKLQQAGKGQAQHHFNGQILSKGNQGHKREDELLDNIFGYTRRLDEARLNNATDADMRLIRRNISANKSNHRKQLVKMFDKAQADGLITYTTYKNKDGEIIYKWVSLMHVKEADAEPDEQ